MKPTAISVILPNYNGAKHIQKALESFARQTQDGTELIIVDAKSTDKSHAIIAEFCEHHTNATWIQEPDSGISDAINIGVRHAKGDVIGYLGSDDVLMPGILQNVVEMTSAIDYDTLYFDSYTYETATRVVHYRRCPNHSFTRENLYRFGTLVGLQNIFIRKKWLVQMPYTISNHYSMDYDFYLRLVELTLAHVYVPQPATINKYGGNISQRLGDKQFQESIQAAILHAKTRHELYLTFLRLHELFGPFAIIKQMFKTGFALLFGRNDWKTKVARQLLQGLPK